MAINAKSKTVKSSSKKITKKANKNAAPKSYRKKILTSMKTTSNIPETATQKKRWRMAERVAMIESGAQSEKEMPFPLVTHIYQEQEKANKTIKKSDVTKAKRSPTVAAYRTKKNPKGLKKLANK